MITKTGQFSWRSLIRLTVLLAVSSLLLSCVRYKDITFSRVDNLKIGKLGMNESIMEMNLIFHNPNRVGATLHHAGGKAWIQDTYVGDFLADKDVKIPAKSSFSVPVKMVVTLKDILKNSVAFILSDSVIIKVEGDATLSKGAIMKTLPLHYNGKKSTEEVMKAFR